MDTQGQGSHQDRALTDVDRLIIVASVNDELKQWLRGTGWRVQSDSLGDQNSGEIRLTNDETAKTPIQLGVRPGQVLLFDGLTLTIAGRGQETS